MHHIFGPVPSRRLGRSLGIDLIPFKTCSFDCVYCECGATTNRTTQRKAFFPTGDILDELEQTLKTDPNLDYITLAGSGEPTLSASLGMVIAYLKDHHPRYRVAVLTNGSLLSDPVVRQELSRADLVIPTLSTISQETFERIHRPVPGLSVERIIEGLIAFRDDYQGTIWLEVFLVPPLNTSPEELSPLRQAIMAVRPDRIQLNMLDRPGTEKWVLAPEPGDIEQIRNYLAETGIPTDVTGNVRTITRSCGNGGISFRIEETLRRRPCTPDDIAGLTGLHPAEVRKQLARMQQQGILTTYRGARGIFYRPAGHGQDD